MANDLVVSTGNHVVTFNEVERMAQAAASSGLFGIKTKEQALILMMIAQAEGVHPALAARDYDIVQGRPAKKAEAMLRDFLRSGGRVEWHEYSDDRADATFSHPAGGAIRVMWDMERAQRAGLGGKEMYKKFPAPMFRSRCISEGVRTVYPMATSGMYVPEEAADISPAPVVHTPPPVREVTSLPIYHDEPQGPPQLIAVEDITIRGPKFAAALKLSDTREEGEKWVALNPKDGWPEKAHKSYDRAVAMMRERLPERAAEDVA